jgi:hypothetical protein
MKYIRWIGIAGGVVSLVASGGCLFLFFAGFDKSAMTLITPAICIPVSSFCLGRLL